VNNISLKKLLFDKKSIYVSDIIGQIYCEKKMEFQYTYGFNRTVNMNIGNEIHSHLEDFDFGLEELDPNEDYTQYEIFEDYSEFPVSAKINDCFISGKIDLILFSNNKPKYIFELKTTSNPNSLKKLYDSEKIQIELYSLLLKKQDYDISDLQSFVVKTDSSISKAEFLTQFTDLFLTLDTDIILPENISKNNFKIFEIKTSHTSLNKLENYILPNKLEYWFGNRLALPTLDNYKCRRCNYNMECKNNIY